MKKDCSHWKNQSGSVLILLTGLLKAIAVGSEEQFQSSSTSDGLNYGYYLKGSVYKTLPSNSYSFCWLRCLENKSCLSLNFDMTTGTCELNKHSKHIELPSNHGVRRNSIHFSKPPPDECIKYTNLTDASRNIKHNMTGKACDSKLNDDGWYRIAGEAGTRLLDYCPTSATCHTLYPRWLDGMQPKIGELKVERKICSRAGNFCCIRPKTVASSNCGTFIVYNLQHIGCPSSYCGQD